MPGKQGDTTEDKVVDARVRQGCNQPGTMAGAGMVARLTVLGSGEEGTGPGVVLSVARVAEYSGEETALMQVV